MASQPDASLSLDRLPYNPIYYTLRGQINYLLTSDFSGPVYNRFPRGECITWVSGGEGALDTPGQWWAKLLRLLTVNSLSYFVKIKY